MPAICPALDAGAHCQIAHFDLPVPALFEFIPTVIDRRTDPSSTWRGAPLGPWLRWTACALSLQLVLPGCEMYRSACNNLCVAPAHFQRHQDRCRTEDHYKHVAREAVGAMCAAHPDQTPSADYLSGFESGVISYLTYGGDPGPPVVPPRKYWKLKYHNPDGYEAAQQWLAGAAEGRRYAIETGLRTLATVPSSSTPVSQTLPVEFHVGPGNTATTAPDVPSGVAPQEPLPPVPADAEEPESLTDPEPVPELPPQT